MKLKSLVLAVLVCTAGVASAQHYPREHEYGHTGGYEHRSFEDRGAMRIEFMDVRDRLTYNIERSMDQPRCRHSAYEARRAIHIYDENIQRFRESQGRVPSDQWISMTANLRAHNRALRQSGCTR